MRDPERIGRVLEKLRALWLSHPDMRLGQLLMNLEKERHTLPDFALRCWNREESEWERLIDSVLKEGHF